MCTTCEQPSFVGPAFRYWKDGNHDFRIVPTMADPKNAKPFILRISSKGHMMANLLVFGVDEAEVRERVRLAIETHVVKDYHYKGRQGKMGDAHNLIQAQRMGNALLGTDPEYTCEVQELNIAEIAQVAWAGNDNVL